MCSIACLRPERVRSKHELAENGVAAATRTAWRDLLRHSAHASSQVEKLLQRIKLQAAGQAEAPPITLPDWITEDDLQDDDEDDDIAAVAAGGAWDPPKPAYRPVEKPIVFLTI